LGLSDSITRDHGQRRQAIVDSLLREVFYGRVKAGQHLVTRELADRFGVSHTPIREALILLAGIGVVDLLPNRGAVVRKVAARDIYEICEVRRALECEAVRTACGAIDAGSLQDLAGELRFLSAADPSDPQYVERARECDNRLHDMVAASCGNAFLGSELTRLKVLFRAFRDVSWEHEIAQAAPIRVAEEAVEHLVIVDALLAGKRQDAVRAMARHISAGARYWSRAVAPLPERRSVPHPIVPESLSFALPTIPAPLNGNGHHAYVPAVALHDALEPVSTGLAASLTE
jgi:DNA-binding GntR family transcriptional regulator